MNVQSLWAGTSYAYHQDLPWYRRNSKFPEGAIEVTVIKVTKEREFGNERLTSRVHVRRASDGREFTCHPNKIVDFWDNYTDEAEHLKAEAERKEQERLQRLERVREENIAFRASIIEALDKLGISNYDVQTVTRTGVTINPSAILQAGGVIERAQESQS